MQEDTTAESQEISIKKRMSAQLGMGLRPTRAYCLFSGPNDIEPDDSCIGW
ncbi:hypothetical protein F2Q69_00029326 [Brassica cretica]|uniref:Uncharacterized protein n=1 Tax=Brassica cretica TaxID=69181 RepID=A0A8S9RY74_BRACR|nr:hypothetical protein F2Q69_00029326 [Brassica cretica]